MQQRSVKAKVSPPSNFVMHLFRSTSYMWRACKSLVANFIGKLTQKIEVTHSLKTIQKLNWQWLYMLPILSYNRRLYIYSCCSWAFETKLTEHYTLLITFNFIDRSHSRLKTWKIARYFLYLSKNTIHDRNQNKE